MEVRLSPERQAQLNDYARRHGKDPAAALNEMLENYLDGNGRTVTPNAVSAYSLGEELRTIGNRCAALPDNDTRTPEEIIGFEEHGVPE